MNNQISKHLLNAETQLAAELANLADRFRKARKGRREMIRKIQDKCDELSHACYLIHAEEVGLPQPIPPLASVAERRLSPAETREVIDAGQEAKYGHHAEMIIKQMEKYPHD